LNADRAPQLKASVVPLAGTPTSDQERRLQNDAGNRRRFGRCSTVPRWCSHHAVARKSRSVDCLAARRQVALYQDKQKAYADFMAGCQRVIEKGKAADSRDWLLLQNSLQMLFLLAPANLVRPAQQLLARTQAVSDSDTKTAAERVEWAEFTDFNDQARIDLGMDVS
jgi:hypothetical protein